MRDNLKKKITSLPFCLCLYFLAAAEYFPLFVLDLSPLLGRRPGTIQIKPMSQFNINYLTMVLIACSRSFLILLKSCFVSSRWLSSICFSDWFQPICFCSTSWPFLMMWSCSWWWWWWWTYFLFRRFPNVLCGWSPSCCCCCVFARILLKKCLERCDIAPGT